jgi:prophage tail gpP-like protein
MPDVRLSVNGRLYDGWKSARVTRGIESVSGSFELVVSDRWAGQSVAWPIVEEDECTLILEGEHVITGYVDRRNLSFGVGDHTLSVAGRDAAAALVDCSAYLKTWEFLGVPLLSLVKKLAAPFGLKISLQPGLTPPSLPAKLTVDPGDSAFDAIERACRMCGILPVSDGKGGVVLTRAGSARCGTAIVQGENVLGASARFDAAGRYRRYIVTGQHPGTDDWDGATVAGVRGEASDPNVRRASRILLVRAEGGVTIEHARRRAQWEAKVRAARGDGITVRVQGWTQGDGKLWPLNARVDVRLPFLGIEGELLITQATHQLDEHGGTTTELWLRRPDAFLPEPVVPKGAWKELVGGVPKSGTTTVKSH